MNVYRSLAQIPADFGPSIVTVGNFDGVHCGHRAVIAQVVQRARTAGVRSALVTFDPHPLAVLRPAEAPKTITPLAARLRLIAETGIDAAVVLPFTETLARTDARTFAQEVLCNGLHAREVHEGENFRFGAGAQADVHQLERLGAEMGFAAHGFSPLQMCGGTVSSSRVRRLIAEGNVTCARHLLGRPFAIESTPAHGRGYGTRYAVPTINLAPYSGLLPGNGVYITELQAGSGSDATLFEGVTNIGNRPTFGADSFAVETHLFRFHPILLSEETPLRLTFLRRLREERRFESPEALKVQIGLDVRRAERWFHLRRVLHAGR